MDISRVSCLGAIKELYYSKSNIEGDIIVTITNYFGGECVDSIHVLALYYVNIMTVQGNIVDFVGKLAEAINFTCK